MWRKWNFAVLLSDKWVVKKNFSTSLNSFWKNGQENFSIILNCEWFSLKSPHYNCRKITFKLLFSWLLHDGSHQHSIIGKKINIVSSHNLTTLTQVILPVFAIFGKKANFFFIFHVTLSVLKRRKWNFTVILTL